MNETGPTDWVYKYMVPMVCNKYYEKFEKNGM